MGESTSKHAKVYDIETNVISAQNINTTDGWLFVKCNVGNFSPTSRYEFSPIPKLKNYPGITLKLYRRYHIFSGPEYHMAILNDACVHIVISKGTNLGVITEVVTPSLII